MSSTATSPTVPTTPVPAGSLSRRVSRTIDARPRLGLGVVLTGPALWLLVAYLGSLAALLLTSLYAIDDAGLVQETVSLANFRDLFTETVYRTITWRTIGVAIAVTAIDVLVAVPAAFYMAKIARPALRSLLVALVLVPLWASYLVKAYAWRAILASPGGVLESSIGTTPGYGMTSLVLVLAYLWLPYMIVPIYAGLERLPSSMLEASSDLGATGFATFWRVVVPLLLPAIVAGSIFAFSLTLGDYIAVGLVGGSTQMIGTVVYSNFASNLPLAAAYATVPVMIMLVYLLAARRTGAFESL